MNSYHKFTLSCFIFVFTLVLTFNQDPKREKTNVEIESKQKPKEKSRPLTNGVLPKERKKKDFVVSNLKLLL